jgi:hypothetical protein
MGCRHCPSYFLFIKLKLCSNMSLLIICKTQLVQLGEMQIIFWIQSSIIFWISKPNGFQCYHPTNEWLLYKTLVVWMLEDQLANASTKNRIEIFVWHWNLYWSNMHFTIA